MGLHEFFPKFGDEIYIIVISIKVTFCNFLIFTYLASTIRRIHYDKMWVEINFSTKIILYIIYHFFTTNDSFSFTPEGITAFILTQISIITEAIVLVTL